MKHNHSVATVLIACSLGVSAGDMPKPGIWTQDLGAAMAVAKEQSIPMLINFTGSDWCGWCKLMDKNVFSTPEWQTYASNKLMLVTIDFPGDKSLVPEKYVARNAELKTKFNVDGFPTYILLDSDGETEIGRLGAGADKNAASFTRETDELLRFTAAGKATYLSTLTPDDRTAYEAILSEIDRTGKEISAKKAMLAEERKKLEALDQSIEDLNAKATEFRAEKAGPEKKKEYDAIKAELTEAQKALDKWLAAAPKRTKETIAEHQGMMANIHRLESRLAEF